jgi:hypothetical protein
MGSVADSVAAKIRIIIDNTNFLARKITHNWISLIYLYLRMLNQGLKSYFFQPNKVFFKVNWLSSELKFKVTLLYVAQLLQLLSFMSLQFLYPFCQLGRRALYNYCFIYMYHKPIVLYIGAKRLFHLKLPP